MTDVGKMYRIDNRYYLPAVEQNVVSDVVSANNSTHHDGYTIPNTAMNGLEALANYNKVPIKTKQSKSEVPPSANIETLIADKKYMDETHRIQMSRDTNNDGKVSVDETLANNYLMYKYPVLGEEDRKALIKYAMSDGNINVNDEEFVRWLEGPEHGKILDIYTVRKAREIEGRL